MKSLDTGVTGAVSGNRPIAQWAAGLVGAAALLSQSGCRKAEVQAEPPPPTVGVVVTTRRNVPIIATPNGTTRALEEVAIRARVRGFLTERHFEEGSNVKKGQLLLVIDEAPYKIALQSAKARQEEAEAAVSKAKHSKAREVAAAKVALDEAQLTLAQIEERRSKALVNRGAAPRDDLDKAEADRKQKEAQVAADRANSDQSKADYDVNILAARAQLDATLASVKDAELELSYCRMSAPFDGRIGEAKVKVGNLVGPASPGGSDNTELATIQQLDPMGVDVYVSSRFLARSTQRVKEGLSIHLSRPGLEGDQDYPHDGRCYFIDNTIDPTTSTFLVKATIPNSEHSLLPGEYVKLRVVVDNVENAVVVPEQAVMETQAGPVVYVVDQSNEVAVQRVEAAQTYQGLRIITRGLDAGIPVIVEGLQLVRPGIPVKSEPAVLPRPSRDESEVETGPEPAAAKPEPPSGGSKSDQTPKPATKGTSPGAAVEPGGPRPSDKGEQAKPTTLAPDSGSPPKS